MNLLEQQTIHLPASPNSCFPLAVSSPIRKKRNDVMNLKHGNSMGVSLTKREKKEGIY